MSRIELKNIDKYFDKNHVLKNISLVIEDGDFMTLLGPSGCGKTTTLRVIAGLEKPQNGILLMNDRKVISCDEEFFEEPSKRNLNLVFQSYALWPHMTVYENVAFGLRIKKLKKSVIDEKVNNALGKMRILEFAKRYPNELSGGQQQRVAIARAIASDPELLLLDEPLSNLDAKLRIDMRSELKRLHSEMGTTIIYVTHDQVEALTMSTKIALFSEGVLTQVSSPIDLYMNPKTLEAADFIGNPKINFIDGKASWDGKKLEAQCEIGSYVFDKKDMSDVELNIGGFDCVFGIRPEQISISRNPGTGLVEASVYTSQLAGSETLVTVKSGDKKMLIKEIGIATYENNQTVYLKFNPRKINIYRKEDEVLIKYAD